MAILFATGFECGTTAGFDYVGNGSLFELSNSQFRSGSYGWTTYGVSLSFLKRIVPKSELYIQFCLRNDNIGIYSSGSDVLVWRKGLSVLGSLRLINSGVLSLYRGTTLVATEAYIEPSQNYCWNVYEIYIKIAEDNVNPDLAGKFILRRNGRVVITFIGDTRPSTDDDIDNVAFGNLSGTNLYAYQYWDDIIIDDANWPNGAKIVGIFPTGPGTSIRRTVIYETGEGYSANDVVTVVQGGASGGTLRILTVDGDGKVLTWEIVTGGTGYTAAEGLATTYGGAGHDFKVDIFCTSTTPSTGANYACLDEVPNSMTDSVLATSVGQVESYITGPNLPADVVNIKAVTWSVYGQRNSVPPCCHLKPCFKNGLNEVIVETTVEPSLIPAAKKVTLENSPLTSVPWTISEIDNMEVGFKTAV